jgi:hypothetical protein
MWEQQNLDPLRVQQWPPRLGTALSVLNTTKHIQRNMELFTTPMYLLGGTEDGQCAPEAVRELHQRARAMDKTITQYEGYGHCILAEEPVRAAKVEADIRAWLVERAQRGKATSWRETPMPRRSRPIGRLLLLIAISVGFVYYWRGHVGLGRVLGGGMPRADL